MQHAISVERFDADAMQIWAEDITDNPEASMQAHRLCVDSYAQGYNDPGMVANAREMLGKLFAQPCSDGERILAAYARTSSIPSMVATSRLNLGNRHKKDHEWPLEFMTLFQAGGGWAGYTEHGFDVSRIVEGKRLAFAESSLDPAAATQVRVSAYHALFRFTYAFGREHGCDQVWGIVPRPIARFVQQRCGIKARVASDVRLNRESPVFEEYRSAVPRYWDRLSPGLYRTYPPE